MNEAETRAELIEPWWNEEDLDQKQNCVIVSQLKMR